MRNGLLLPIDAGNPVNWTSPFAQGLLGMFVAEGHATHQWRNYANPNVPLKYTKDTYYPDSTVPGPGGWFQASKRNISGTTVGFSVGDANYASVTGAMTLATWFLVTDTAGWASSAWGINRCGSIPRGPALALDASSIATIYVASDSSTLSSASSTVGLEKYRWHLVVGTYLPSTNIRLYSDGVLLATTAVAFSSQYIPSSYAWGLRDRADNAYTVHSAAVGPGYIWNRCFGPDEVRQLYQDGLAGHPSLLNHVPRRRWFLSSGPASATGTLSSSLMACQPSGIGTVTTTGTTSSLLAPVVLATACGVLVAGSVQSQTADVLLAGGAGSLAFGTTAESLGSLVSDVQGRSVLTVTGTETTDSVLGSGVGSNPVGATAAVSLASVVESSVGADPLVGSTAAILAESSLTGSASPLVAATLAETADPVSGSSVGIVDLVGGIAGSLAAVVLDGIGQSFSGLGASVTAVLAAVVGSGSASTSSNGTVASPTADVTGSSVGNGIVSGAMTETLGPVQCLSDTAQPASGSLSTGLASATLSASSTALGPITGLVSAILDAVTCCGIQTVSASGSLVAGLDRTQLVGLGTPLLSAGLVDELDDVRAYAVGQPFDALVGSLDGELSSARGRGTGIVGSMHRRRVGPKILVRLARRT